MAMPDAKYSSRSCTANLLLRMHGRPDRLPFSIVILSRFDPAFFKLGPRDRDPITVLSDKRARCIT